MRLSGSACSSVPGTFSRACARIVEPHRPCVRHETIMKVQISYFLCQFHQRRIWHLYQVVRMLELSYLLKRTCGQLCCIYAVISFHKKGTILRQTIQRNRFLQCIIWWCICMMHSDKVSRWYDIYHENLRFHTISKIWIFKKASSLG